jgi:hypothetical protein
MPQVLFRHTKIKTPNWQAFRNEIAKTLDSEVKPELIAYFDRIVAPWKNKPEFQARKFIRNDSYSVYVYPTGENADIWRYVSKGTRPHVIKPKGPGYPLKFKWGGPGSYKARTNMSGGYKGPGKMIGGKIVKPWKVNHPGNKPRNFEKHIARWYGPKFRRTMDAAVRRGVAAVKRGAK